MSAKNVSRIVSPFGLVCLAYAILCVIYLGWTWGEELGDFGGDNAFYLLMARHLSPWSESSLVSAYFFSQSTYPPLYPLILALFGGGESLLAAHLVTTVALLLAFAVMYTWQRALDIPLQRAALIVLLFAALPGTYLEALSILSENLYLLLSLVCLLSVVRAERSSDNRWFWCATAAVAAATLTRSAGLALLAAFVAYLFLHRPKQYVWMVALAVAPMALWNVALRIDGPGYVDQLRRHFGAASASDGWQYLASQIAALWHGWLGGMTISGVMVPVLAMVMLVCLCGFIYRLWRRQFDGIYVAFYLLMLLSWPYPAEAVRFVFAVLPILLVQGLLWLQWACRAAPQWSISAAMVAYFSVIVLAAFPALALTVTRFFEPLPAELAQYARNRYWYAPEIEKARNGVAQIHAMVTGFRAVARAMPEGACVISIKPPLIGLYAGRISKSPPALSVPDAAFRTQLKDMGCSYAFFMSHTSPAANVAFYPIERVTVARYLLVVRTEKNATVSILSKIDL